jgi:hypothetical protein
MMDDPKTQMRQLLSNFHAAAAAVAGAPASDARDALHFLELPYAPGTAHVFRRLGIAGLPFIAHLGPDWAPPAAGAGGAPPPSDPIPESLRMSGAPGEPYPWSPAAFAAFFAARAGVGGVVVPGPSLWEVARERAGLLGGAAAAGIAGAAAAVRWRLWANKWTYFLGALIVFWLSTSGVAYTYIRNVPWTTVDKEGRTQWMLTGQRGAQLGAEGLVMGSSYVGASALATALAYGVPRVASAAARRGLAYALIAGLLYAVHAILGVYGTKTGYAARTYLW